MVIVSDDEKGGDDSQTILKSHFSLRFVNHTDRLSQSFLVAAIVLVVVEEMYLLKESIILGLS